MDKRGTISAFLNAERSPGAEFRWAAGVAGLVFFIASTGVFAKEPSSASEPPSSSNAAASVFREERPPTGKGNLFSEEQVSYCLAQIIRIEAVRNLVDKYRRAQVQYFNGLTADYNSRCASYTYEGNARDNAKAAVEAARSQIEAEARSDYGARFVEEEKLAVPTKPVTTPAPPQGEKQAQTRTPLSPASPASRSGQLAPISPSGSETMLRAERASGLRPPAITESQPASKTPPASEPASASEPSGRTETANAPKPTAWEPPALPEPPAASESAPVSAPSPAAETPPVSQPSAASEPRTGSKPSTHSEPPSVSLPANKPPPASRSLPATSPPRALKTPPSTLAKVEVTSDAALGRFSAEVRRVGSQVLAGAGDPKAPGDKARDAAAQIEVRFAVGGYIRSVVLGQSSGDPLLDERALAIARSLRLPDVPEELRSRDFAVRFPIVFLP